MGGGGGGDRSAVSIVHMTDPDTQFSLCDCIRNWALCVCGCFGDNKQMNKRLASGEPLAGRGERGHLAAFLENDITQN